ncbi:MAG: aromatic acid decarboxylase [Candidatus Altiarchaeales archaeon]|nr:MAG: aromatic acid decarboxylase [Candidatus Altiarchaeales archaeon]RLI95166.1 MAG: aromatic acid decarboxylase [Candidatus Altiarchaeales archaeon]RLI95436.1 MAG: aromatic acid decarboxylase [Candidatus Altiarchaeales archaeon]HDO82113.1 UbiX family flavin prenyltransferase [Candidatus Altiarchaeales archaeon]HEX54762.1 UbiX family flavin prenyltransferase [Candidatus Altiarchaeales archaeon]
MKIIVAITGASGAVLAERLLENLARHERYVIISNSAGIILELEDIRLERIMELSTKFYRNSEIDSELASSSYSKDIDAMVVIPCSMKTLSAIANGFANNLIVRCAENMLKFNKKLILVPRETPLSLSAIENMLKLRISGAIILPPNIAYYHKPKSLDDMTNFIVGKVLDSLEIEHNLYKKWEGRR